MWYLILSSFLWFFKVGPSAFKLSSHGHDIHIIADASSSVTVKVCFIWRLFLIALRRHWLIVRHPGRSKERWSAFAVTWTAKLFLNCVILSVARSRLELWWPLLINWTTAIKESNASGCLTKSEASYGRWSSLLSFFTIQLCYLYCLHFFPVRNKIPATTNTIFLLPPYLRPLALRPMMDVSYDVRWLLCAVPMKPNVSLLVPWRNADHHATDYTATSSQLS